MMPTLNFTEDLIYGHFSLIYDDGGVSMYEHMKRVHARVTQYDIETQHIAWLHDLIEDTDVTADDLRSMGYSDTIIEAVLLLTKPDKEPYAQYIDRLCQSGNQRAIIVKLADNADNTDPKRWLYLNPYKAQALSKRYHGVRAKLEEALK
jgi:(p)ppGpp synthase/HD superfamily hydrolase